MTREAERKRLVELICKQTCNYNTCENSIDCLHCKFVSLCDEEAEDLADALLDNGIVVPPCKVGDAIFRIDDKKVFDWWDVEHIEIYADEIVYIDDSGNKFTEEDIGKTVFLTREEAEKALEGIGE